MAATYRSGRMVSGFCVLIFICPSQMYGYSSLINLLNLLNVNFVSILATIFEIDADVEEYHLLGVAC